MYFWKQICWVLCDKTLLPWVASASAGCTFWLTKKKKVAMKKTAAGSWKKSWQGIENERAHKEGGEMLNRWGAERESKRYWHGRNWGKLGFTFHLNGMMSSARWRGDGTAELPRPCGGAIHSIHSHFKPINPSGHAHRVLVFPTLSRLSSALDAIIALLMHSHMGDAWSPPACQHTLAAPTLLFVCARCLRDEALGQL